MSEQVASCASEIAGHTTVQRSGLEHNIMLQKKKKKGAGWQSRTLKWLGKHKIVNKDGETSNVGESGLKSHLLFSPSRAGQDLSGLYVCFILVVFLIHQILLPPRGKREMFCYQNKMDKGCVPEDVSSFYCLTLKTVQTAPEMQAYPARGKK